MAKCIKISIFVLLAFQAGSSAAAEPSFEGRKTNVLEIRSVVVGNKSLPLSSQGKLQLGPLPKNISFNFGPAPNASRVPIRLRYELDGYDENWRENQGQMFLSVRFFNEARDQVSEKDFDVNGESAGWHGDLKSSSLTHRRETLVVPPRAARLWIVISSAGGPATVGIYVVDKLIVARPSSNNVSEVLLRSPFDSPEKDYAADQMPDGWIHDGTHPSMAKIVELGQKPATQAFAILDDDPLSHAEWHCIMESAPKVVPGDRLVVEWDEFFSIGHGNTGFANYSSLPQGNFVFHVEETTAMGVPTGVGASLTVLVPPPFWEKPWFLGVIFSIVTLIIIAVARNVIRRRIRQEMLHLENQRTLERERLRIAHDLHDDLGAQVTQISLLSAMAHDDRTLPQRARAEFDRISKMSRGLVSALYETVWAVNPENDNLDALGNYLCQMANQLCDQAHLRCRLHVQELPSSIQISSQIRHHITMAVKESLHNVIKHAKAEEVIVRMTFDGMLLTISIQDDGHGFQPADNSSGSGLKNIKQRLEDFGGSCTIESQPGHGTMVSMRLICKPPH